MLERGQLQLLVQPLAQIAMPGHGHQFLVLRYLLSANFAGTVAIQYLHRPLPSHHASLAMLALGLFPEILSVQTAMLERGLWSLVLRQQPNALSVMRVLIRQ